MRTLIIGDLHHRTRTADAILASEPHDRVVFLGDYFDDFSDTPGDALATAAWVKQRLSEARCTLLWGNHDLPYAFDADDFPFLSCSGFQRNKLDAIKTVLGPDDWDRLQAYAQVGPWLISHAGFHRDLLPREIVRNQSLLRERCTQAFHSLERREPDLVFAAGKERGGRATIGGITWCDWKRFEGIDGVHQIVGHTPSSDEPLRHWSPPGSTNYCIDYRKGHTYAVVTEERTFFKQLQPAGRESFNLGEVEHEALGRARHA
ncbi:MAG: metallophosphoesterase [Verrucomicrobia bacterium]|nr:metallophosphoesterase [Verrucomicrobiota bacterium]